MYIVLKDVNYIFDKREENDRIINVTAEINKKHEDKKLKVNT
jgi:hypothetical protein